MSISFYIPNRRGIFGYKAVETPDAILSLVEGLEPVGLKELECYQPMDQLDCFVAIYKRESGRGFELYYDREQASYQIRLLTPSTIGDWKGAIRLMSHLAKKLRQEIRDEYGTVYTADGIFDIHFEADILFGLNHAREADQPLHVFPGYAHDLYLSRDALLGLFEEEDPIVVFSRRMTEMQQVSGYFGQAKYYRSQEGRYLGVYTLTEGQELILPREPIPAAYVIRDMVDNAVQDVDWELSIIVRDSSSPDGHKFLTSADLQAFIHQLPEGSYSYLDSSQIRISPLSRPELEQLLAALDDKE